MIDAPTTLVTTPFDMAKVLFKASAFSAAAYALAAQETARELSDETRIAFWHAVGCELEIMRDALEEPPALRVA